MTLAHHPPAVSLSSQPAVDALPAVAVGAAFSFAATPELVKALRGGDEAAFRWLHAQWNGRLARYAAALTAGDTTMAGEVVQATWLRLARSLRAVPDEAALWCWMARAARNAATDMQRTGGRYRAALRRFTEWLRPAPDPEPAVFAALDAALAALTAEERALLELRYTAREPLDATATRLGCSARAVEGRLARIREKLRLHISTELQRPDHS